MLFCLRFGHPLLPYHLLPAALSTGLGEQCANTAFCSEYKNHATHRLVAGGQSPASNTSRSQAVAGTGIPTPGSCLGVIWCHHHLQQEGKNEEGAGSCPQPELMRCMGDHSHPSSFVLSASKSYGENRNKPRKV